MDRSYVAIDIETTGLDAKQDKIIEIGAVKVRDRAVFHVCQSQKRASGADCPADRNPGVHAGRRAGH